ncbi:hypothetical protein PR048_002758 [Dryococelus australis]|uniref:Uncharacterized protein n=1 Tax=Dryococelus australis TaxID=614101 RepID=A0ABQ9ILR1_9NEOP|nr:hypothetical protein PR048_002758 [Dryococelus australis]
MPSPRNFSKCRVASRALVPRIFLRILLTRRLLQQGSRRGCDAIQIAAVNHSSGEWVSLRDWWVERTGTEFTLPCHLSYFNLLNSSEICLLTNSQCGKRTENLPHRGRRGVSPRPSDYMSATLTLSHGGRTFYCLRKLNTISAYTRQKAKSKYRNRILLERASQKQSTNTHKTPHDRVKRCKERKINIKVSERVNVVVFTQNKRLCLQHSQTQFSSSSSLRPASENSPHPFTNLTGSTGLCLSTSSRSYAWLHHRGSKFDPRSHLRSAQKTVALFEFRTRLEIEMKFISNLLNWRFQNSIRDQQPSSTNIEESEVQNHEISLVQHFYIGTKIKLDPGPELGISDRGRCWYNRALVDKIDVKHVYTEVDFAIGSQFIEQALVDSEPIADLQGASAILPGVTRSVSGKLLACRSDTSLVLRALHSQSGNGYAHITRIATPSRPCVLTYSARGLAVVYWDNPISGTSKIIREGAAVAELLACSPFPQGDQGPSRATGFSHVIIVLDDAIGQRVFSGISRFSLPSPIWAPLHTHLNHPHRR